MYLNSRSLFLVLTMFLLMACEARSTSDGQNNTDDQDTEIGQDIVADAGTVDTASADTVSPVPDTNTTDTTTIPDTNTGDVTNVSDTVSPEDVEAIEDTGTVGPIEDVTQTPDAEEYIEESFSLDLPPFTLAPGQEVTKCVNLPLTNDNPVYIHEITTTLEQGSHHLIVYRSAEEETQDVPENCFPFAETLSMASAPLIISQLGGETLTFPEGVGIEFEPQQMIRLEAHFINYTGEDLEANASVTFKTMKPSDVEAVADMLFYGDLDINIPAFGEKVVGPTWLPVDEGTKVFGVTGHTHQYGTDVTLWKGTAEETGEPIYDFEVYDWDEPPVAFYDPPLEFSAGEGFRIQCSYVNTSGKSVGFGESANEEMCFAWAYYYPAQGFQICASHPLLTQYVGVETLCCPDDALCDLLLGFAGNL